MYLAAPHRFVAFVVGGAFMACGPLGCTDASPQGADAASADLQESSRDLQGPPPKVYVRPSESPELMFRDITDWAGLGAASQPHGWTFIDLDDDGDDDLIRPGLEHATIFLNRGDGSFQKTGQINYPELGSFSYAVDLTGDGRLDLLAITTAGAFLYQSGGDGSLTPRPDLLAHAGSPDMLVCATFADYFGRGHLDLFVGALATLASLDPGPGDAPRRGSGGRPSGFSGDPAPDRFFRATPQGFQDQAAKVGLKAVYNTLSAMSVDLDGDGRVDLLVGTEGDVQDHFYLSRNNGTFVPGNKLLGIQNSGGRDLVTTSAMGMDAADIDNDGDLDLYITDDDINNGDKLWVQTRPGRFENRTTQAGLDDTRYHIGWGVGLHDFDHDGDLDIFVANGQIYASAEGTPQENLYYQGDGSGFFQRVESPQGSGLSALEVSQGALFSDIDLDGDLDVLVLNKNHAPTLLRNDMGARGHWLQVKLVDPAFAPAVGAILSLQAGSRPLKRWLKGTTSYGGSSTELLHVGLDDATVATHVQVRWPDGTLESFPDLPADVRVTLKRGQGSPP